MFDTREPLTGKPPQPRTPTPPAPRPLKAGTQTWQRTFRGAANGITFQLRIIRKPNGHLSARYQATPGKGSGWHLEGHLRDDNTFTLKGTQNNAEFQGTISPDGKTVTSSFTNVTTKDTFTVSELTLRMAAWVNTSQAVQSQQNTGASSSTGPQQSDSSAADWEKTITPEMRKRLPALSEPDFIAKLNEMCKRIGIPSDLLLAVMTFESADHDHGTRGLDPKADNGLGYYGLIQFGPEAAKDLGLVTAKDFQKMSATEQLPYVEKFLKTHGVPQAVAKAKSENRNITLEEIYMSILGGNANKAYSSVWKTKAANPSGYKNNSGLDSNGDFAITPTEAADAVRLHWREVYGNNIDERSRHLERQWYTARNPDTNRIERKWKSVYHSGIFSDKLNNTFDGQLPSQQGQGSPAPGSQQNQNQNSQQSGSIKEISAAGKRTIRNNKDWGTEIGSLDGVKSYYNDGVKSAEESASGDRNYSTDGNKYEYGLKWQCVEFVRRYYYDRLGVEFVPRSGNAEDYFDKNTPSGSTNTRRKLTQFKIDSTEKPKYQDLIIFGPNPFSSVGHVAIVSSSSDDNFTIAQQNVGVKFTDTIGLESKSVAGKKIYKISQSHRSLNVMGWLRK
ncbi:CHAP domain-containing protein [Deinococcus xianganensis]|uniref:CHAP domain-containing protein n=1 Tax=Deinococcus xianganensis TaxID=1507289 RepID=A0A6I4YFV8_9DEIO|nr:CHAP domain-containing protein [Deinococcus xianganensis]MXV18891.1 CHAP domain-containing protein [Deinococcus xianganensis]